MQLPQMIKELRAKLGMSRNEFTNALGLKTRVTTRHWERNLRKPNVTSCYKLLKLANEAGLDWTLEMFTSIPVEEEETTGN